MTLTRTTLVLLATLGAAALLLGAYGFEYIGGFAPCELCLLQRWPPAIAIVIGVLALIRPAPLLLLAGAATMAVSAAFGAYHTGVQQHWWPGPAACTGSGDIGSLTPEQLMAQIMTAPVVRCDEVDLVIFGIPMPVWNVAASLALCVLWLWALRAPARPQASSSASQ